MNRSEESITLMTSYRLPHHGRRSFFTFVQDMGLRKIGDKSVQPDNDQTRGKIAQIGYLLQVTEEK